MLRLPKGTSDFKSIIDEEFYLIDKTLFIKEIIDDASRIILLPRPRRFGKTTNMSMLRYFFDCTGDNKYLFNGLNITRAGNAYMKHQGQYPVVFLTLKDANRLNFQDTLEAIQDLICVAYTACSYLLKSDHLEQNEIDQIKRIMYKQAPQSEIASSLRFLTQALQKHHQKPVVLLIDEYDAPMHASFSTENSFVSEMTNFMRSFLGAALKDNNALHRAVVTGILQIAQASLFSGLNNVNVCNLLATEYSDCFGFTQSEVDMLFEKAKLSYDREEIKKWYNGYRMGVDTTVYNPWSIISCILKNGRVGTYWLETGGSGIIQKALETYRSETILKNMQSLIEAETVVKTISMHTVLGDLENDETALWTLLLFAGYLTVYDHEILEISHEIRGIIAAPNKEVRGAFVRWTRSLYESSMGIGNYREFLNALITGDLHTFLQGLRDYLSSSVSYFDLNKKSKEHLYHVFFLGLLVGLRESYQIKSNQESGKGRCDIILIPRKQNQIGVIMEFKAVSDEKELDTAAKAALKQIQTQNYEVNLQTSGTQKTLLVGLSFWGKEVKLEYALND